MTTGELSSTILTFAAIVGIGALLRATRILRAEDARPLNSVIIYVGLPAFVVRAVRGAEFGFELLGVVALSWLVFSLVLALSWLLSATRAQSRPRRGAFLLAAAFGNTGYIGYPIAAALLGAGALPLAVFSDVFGTVFALVLCGLGIAARFGSGGKRVNVVRELVTFPAVIALFAGLVLRPFTLPQPVSSGLEMLAGLVAPLIMLSVGLSLRPLSLARSTADVALVAVVRLALAPLLALVIGEAMLDGEALQVAVLQAGMPTMMLSYVVGQRYGLDTEFIASAIFVTTVLSAVTIPLVQSVAF